MRTSRAPRHEQALTLEELMEEHLALDGRLGELHKHLSLTPEEQYEAMVIKKRKLVLKDRIILLKAQQEHALTPTNTSTPEAEDFIHSPVQSWSARQRFELIMEMIRLHKDIDETADAHGLDPQTVEHWYQSFTVGALRALEPQHKTLLSVAEDDVMLNTVRQRLHALMTDIDAKLNTPS